MYAETATGSQGTGLLACLALVMELYVDLLGGSSNAGLHTHIVSWHPEEVPA